MSASGWASGSAPESVGSASATTSGLSLCRAAASEIHVGRPATGGDVGATADAALLAGAAAATVGAATNALSLPTEAAAAVAAFPSTPAFGDSGGGSRWAAAEGH